MGAKKKKKKNKEKISRTGKIINKSVVMCTLVLNDTMPVHVDSFLEFF